LKYFFMMRDELSGLNALLAVAEHRSFTAAAAQLGISASAVSQAVRSLEERVGVRLLQRTTRSVGLTEAGAHFLAQLRPAMATIRDAFATLGDVRKRPAGTLRLSVPRLGYQQAIAPRLEQFMAAYPDITLDISVDDGLVDIVKAGYDAGIRIGEMVEADMVSVPIGPPQVAAVVGSPSYFAKHPAPKHPRDLPAHACIAYRRRTLGTVYRWEFTDRGKDFDVAITGPLLINDNDLMIDAALRGLGLAHVLVSSVTEHLASKRLVRVLAGYCDPFPGLYLYYPTRAQLPPKLATLVAALRVTRRRRAPV
jgi:DNA-binding transcriptional LysR family regulator